MKPTSDPAINPSVLIAAVKVIIANSKQGSGPAKHSIRYSPNYQKDLSLWAAHLEERSNTLQLFGLDDLSTYNEHLLPIECHGLEAK